MRTVERTSRLAAPPDAVWARVSTLAGVNAELAPLVRMRAPAGTRVEDLIDRDLACPLLLLGVLPIDLHRLHLEHVDPPHGFRERSTTLLHRAWHHDRTLRPDGAGGTLLTDRVAYAPRVPVPRALVAAVFAHRHRRLARTFGSGSPAR